MAKKKIKRLNKEWYVCDEYGHTDKMLVIKVNELIGIVNHQREVIHDLELLLKNNGVKSRQEETNMSDSILLIISCWYIVFSVFILIKNTIVYRNTMKVIYAIHEYNMVELRRRELLDEMDQFKPIPYDCITPHIDAVLSLKYWTVNSLVSINVLNKIECYI